MWIKYSIILQMSSGVIGCADKMTKKLDEYSDQGEAFELKE